VLSTGNYLRAAAAVRYSKYLEKHDPAFCESNCFSSDTLSPNELGGIFAT